MSTERLQSSPSPAAHSTTSPPAKARPRAPDTATRILLKVFERIEIGSLGLHLPDGGHVTVHGSRAGTHGSLVIHDPAAARRALLGGGTGFAEGYLAGWWDSPDLIALLDVLAANIALGLIETRIAALQPLHRLTHVVRPNTHRGARRNVAYHYDLGNDFYRLWLDPSMTYSAAFFPEETPATCHRGTCPSPAGPLPRAADADALGAAQRTKWDRLLDLLDLEAGNRLLDIGSGWGGLALHAAENRRLHVTGVTLSREQLGHSRQEARRRGLEDRVEFHLRDYRDIEGRWDGVVSVEMFEAVGERYWPSFFAAIRRALLPGGRAAVQVITIDESRYSLYRHTTDFIQQYVFPGGMLPSPTAFRAAAVDQDLSVGPPAFFGTSYAKTLKTWLERFDSAATDLEQLDLDERFRRLWRYYLAYCVAGFRNGLIDVMQVKLTAPAEQAAP